MPRTKGARNLSADAVLRKSFMRTFRRAGGEAWLLEQAKAAPLEFLKALIAVTKPPPQAKATEPVEPQQAALLSDFEAAKRVAYCLSAAMHATGEPLVVEGEIVEQAKPPADWTPPVDQQAVEQPERRSLADLLGFEPPPVAEPSLYGGGTGQYRSSNPAEQGTQRRDLIGDVRVVRERVIDKRRRQTGG